MLRKFRLIKQMPGIKIGTILEEQENCINYICTDKSFFEFDDMNKLTITKQSVENSPDWFEEIYTPTLPVRLKDKFNKFIEGLKG